MRWTKFYDITSTPLWKNDRIIRVYTWLALHQDGDDGLCTSLRRLALSTRCSLGSVRNSIRQLSRYNFIELVSLDPLCIRTIDPGKAHRWGAAFDPKQILSANIDNIGAAVLSSRQALEENIEQFLRIQSIAGRSWTNETECVKHFVNWFLKNDHRQHQQRLSTMQSENKEYDFVQSCKDLIKDAKSGDLWAQRTLQNEYMSEQFAQRGWKLDTHSWDVFVPKGEKK